VALTVAATAAFAVAVAAAAVVFCDGGCRTGCLIYGCGDGDAVFVECLVVFGGDGGVLTAVVFAAVFIV